MITRLKQTNPDIKQQRKLTNQLLEINKTMFSTVSKNIINFLEDGRNPLLYISESESEFMSRYKDISKSHCELFVEQSVNNAMNQIEKNLIKNNIPTGYDSKKIIFNKGQQKNRLQYWINTIPIVFFDKLTEKLASSFNFGIIDNDITDLSTGFKNIYIPIDNIIDTSLNVFLDERKRLISEKLLNSFEITTKQMKDLVLSNHRLQEIIDNRTKRIIFQEQLRIIAEVNSERYSQVGITSYIWMTSGDERVVGNPRGLYPKGTREHQDHYIRNGKEFRFDTPPSDGHPGTAYCCRCVELPIIRK